MASVQWPELRISPGRRLVRWVGYAFLGVLLTFVVLVLVGAVYQAAGLQQDQRDFPPPGMMVDIGGHRLHAQVQGSGSPTVVFDAGLGMTVLDWSLVAPEIAKRTQVVTYDRSGLGWSESGKVPRTARQAAVELHTLLTRLKDSGVEGPYVLVGHSLGGHHVRMFYHLYPEEVAGMVLVDASHEDQWDSLVERTEWTERWEQIQYTAYQGLACVGAFRLAGERLGGEVAREHREALSGPNQEAFSALYATPKVFRTIAAEFAGVRDSSQEVRSTRVSLGDRPLGVVTAGKMPDAALLPSGMSAEQYRATWIGLQKDLASLSTRGEHIVAKQSGHFVQLNEPDVVIRAIDRVVGLCRQDREEEQARNQALLVRALFGDPKD